MLITIQDQDSFEINFKDVEDKYFFDIDNHKSIKEPKTWSLYCAYYSGFRKLKLSKSDHIL